LPLLDGFDTDIELRSKTRLVGVDVGDDYASPSSLDAFERAIEKLKEEGVTTRYVMFCNPHNPLGFNYPRETILAYCRFAEKHNLHLISDEIYALSQFANEEVKNPEPFVSVLSIDVLKEAGCNPSRVHVIYGMSKDFSANGLRIGEQFYFTSYTRLLDNFIVSGVFVTQHNPKLRMAFMGIGIFTKVSSVAVSLPPSRFLDARNDKSLGLSVVCVVE
jgi:1-aminocyclopropane-1-carboxylate synthase